MISYFSRFFSSLQKTVRGIQRSNEETKKRWFFGGVAVSIVLVLGIWMLFLNITIESALPEKMVEEGGYVQTPEDPNSVTNTFKRGAMYVWEDIYDLYSSVSASVMERFTSLQNRIEEKNEIYVEGKKKDFTTNSLEKVPPTPLP